MTAWNLDQLALGAFDARDLLGLAWLCEQAARSCDMDGNLSWGDQLRSDAAKVRATAMQEAGGARI